MGSSSSSSSCCLAILLVALNYLSCSGQESVSFNSMVEQAVNVSVAKINQLNTGPRLYKASHVAVHRISQVNESYELLLDLVARETQCGRGLEMHLDRCAIKRGPAALCSSVIQVSPDQTRVRYLKCSQSGVIVSSSSSSSTSESLENDGQLPAQPEPPIIINALRNTSAGVTTICDGVVDCAPFLL